MTTSLVRTRHASADDVGAVLELYERCSPHTLELRFHVPVARVPARVVRDLVQPPDGWSVVAEQGEEVIGHGCAAPVSTSRVEIGLLVDDAFQGTGVGTRLLRDLAASATERGFTTMMCSVAPDNVSVLPTVRRAGLDGLSTYVDGVVEIEIPLVAGSAELRLPA
jgi:ribosomal protein S18 acetylase RimI-like enzyme